MYIIYIKEHAQPHIHQVLMYIKETYMTDVLDKYDDVKKYHKKKVDYNEVQYLHRESKKYHAGDIWPRENCNFMT